MSVCDATPETIQRLRNDIKSPVKKEGSGSTRDVPTVFEEIRDLKENPGSFKAAVTSLRYKYHHSPESLKSIFLYIIELLRKKNNKCER